MFLKMQIHIFKCFILIKLKFERNIERGYIQLAGCLHSKKDVEKVFGRVTGCY